jgi:hypothetical protein
MYVHPQDAFGVIKFTPVYTSTRHEPKKDQLTGEAIELLQDFIDKHYTEPYLRTRFEKSKF